jgi:hypothetical protein
VTAFAAAETSLAPSIAGRASLTARSRQTGRMRSMQSRSATGSPASANSTALRVNASDSPSSSTAAASVALLREPRRRPAGLPDRPFSKGRPRTRRRGLSSSSAIVISLYYRPYDYRNASGRLCYVILVI